MNEAPGLSDQYRTASPWPAFIALGIPIPELGLLFDLFPLAVGGLLLFGGSVTGILKESGCVTSTIHVATVLMVVFLALDARLAFTNIILVTRGYTVVAVAILLTVDSVVFELFVRE